MEALIVAAPMLGLIGIGVVGVAVFGRDPKAEEHDLSDYKEPTPELDAMKARIIAGLKHGRPVVLPPTRDDILPPAPPGMDAGSPLYAETLFRQWFPESPEQAAARILRELRDEALAGAR